jgi:hypothetical protein
MGLVDLDALGQRLAGRPDHRPADLVQPGPGGLVAGEAHLPLQLGGGDPALARGHQVDRQKPARQPGRGLLEDGPGQERVLLAAGRALVDDLGPERVGIVVPASHATKPLRPACLGQVVTTLFVSTEPIDERR